jgi:hypothetical protein
MRAGNNMANGGTHHSGKVRTKAPMAKMTDKIVQATPCIKDPPWRRSRWGNLRAATTFTKAGVIMKDTANKDMTTTKGVTAMMMIKGATTDLRLIRPTRSNQAHAQPMALLDSIQVRTPFKAKSQ